MKTLKKYLSIFMLVFPILISVPYVGAAPVQWSVNNHWYEAVYVENGINWWDAKKEAEKKGGYLATSTSSGENDFIYSLINFYENQYLWHWDGAIGLGPWLGGYQLNNEDEPRGNWAWISGEPWSYTNWEPAEPNNSGGSEDYLHFIYNTYHWPPDPKKWNDVGGNFQAKGYIVEWNTNPVPLPSALMLLGSGLGLIGLRSIARRF